VVSRSQCARQGRLHPALFRIERDLYSLRDFPRWLNLFLKHSKMKFKNNKDIVAYFGKEFVSGNNLAVYEEIVAKDFVDHAIPNGTYQTMLDTFQYLRAGMPDMRVDMYRLIEEGDCVTSLKSLKGTHTGAELFGVPATGRLVQIDLIDILRFRDGQFVENWVFNNNADVIKALQTNTPIPNLMVEKLLAL